MEETKFLSMKQKMDIQKKVLCENEDRYQRQLAGD